MEELVEELVWKYISEVAKWGEDPLPVKSDLSSMECINLVVGFEKLVERLTDVTA
jgi:hypothetical protein